MSGRPTRREFLGAGALLASSLLMPTTAYAQDTPKTPAKIYFTEGSGYESEVWVMDDDGGNAKRITQNSYEENGPAISPDGKYLAYSRYSHKRPSDFPYYIHVQETSSGKETVYEGLKSHFTMNDIVWSPTGRRLASTIALANPSGGVATNGIFLFDFDPEKLEINYNAKDRLWNMGQYDPSFSPDGKHAVYHSSRGLQIDDRNIDFLVRDEETEYRWRDSHTHSCNSLWSPRGDNILIAICKMGTGKILLCTMDNDGKNQKVLATVVYEFDTPRLHSNPGRWSPDGSKVAYITHNSYLDYKMHIVDVDSMKTTSMPLEKTPVRIYPPDGWFDGPDAMHNRYYLHWSPAGDSLLFRAQLKKEKDKLIFCACRINADGSGFKVVKENINQIVAYRK